MRKATVALVIIIVLAGFTALSDIISPFVGWFVSSGKLVYSYTEGEDPIVGVGFFLDPSLAQNINIKEVPSGWSYSLEDNVLTLIGGGLAPGNSLVVEYSLKKYMPPGTLPLKAIGVTSKGDEVIAEGEVVITENIILLIIYIFIILKVPILIILIILALILIYLALRKRAPIEREEEPEPLTEKPKPPVEETPSPKPGKPSTPPPPPPPPTKPKIKEDKCQLELKWRPYVFYLEAEAKGGRKPAGEPLPLRLYGVDMHVLSLECRCPKNPNVVARKNIYMQAKLRYEWALNGDGYLIERTDAAKKAKFAIGSQILYMPPDLKKDGDTASATIVGYAIHDDPDKKPYHEKIQVIIAVEVTRVIREVKSKNPIKTYKSTKDRKSKYIVYEDPGDIEDYYLYKVYITKPEKRYTTPPPEAKGVCTPTYKWEAGEGIDARINELPQDVDGDPIIVAPGEYVRISGEAKDRDILVVKCIPSGGTCKVPCENKIPLNDVISYEWSASAGEFPFKNTASNDIIWRAPEKEGDIEIVLTAKDLGGQYRDKPIKLRKIIKVRRMGIDLTKTPRNWLPDANAGTVTHTARLYICKNSRWIPTKRKRFIRFKLKKVSGEKGVCMNYPINGNQNPDLFFYKEKLEEKFNLYHDYTQSKDCPVEIVSDKINPKHEHHHLLIVSKERMNECYSITRCEDYGAVGYLEAKAEHCQPIPPRENETAEQNHCKVGDNTVKIPRDDNNNDIADVHEFYYGLEPDEDIDPIPVGDGYKGDGLTNYEEYRGFIIGGGHDKKIHIRTRVDIKDVFIYDQDRLGYGYLYKVGFKIHLLYDPTLINGVDSRVINFNRGRHSGGEQHAIWLRRKRLPEHIVGKACVDPKVFRRTRKVNGPPYTKTHVCVDVFQLQRSGIKAIYETIAHELAHSLDVDHHGDAGKHYCNGYDDICFEHGVTSGVENCIMRYNFYANGWCHVEKRWYTKIPLFGSTLKKYVAPHHVHLAYIKTRNNKPVYDERHRTISIEEHSNEFCSSKVATGKNIGDDYRNDAARGNCLGQFRVKDW